MANHNMVWDDTVEAYVRQECLRESETGKRLRAYTAGLPQAEMQISPAQGQWMAWLVRVLEVASALEVGVFTGYSALWVAEALPPEGKLIACEKEEKWAQIAQKFWEEAGVANKVELKLGDAVDSLAELQATHAGSFDLAFIDADKASYPAYYEAILPLIRSGGVILLDNMLQMGRVADLRQQDKRTQVIRQLNHQLKKDERVEIAMMPFGDGLMVVRKR